MTPSRGGRWVVGVVLALLGVTAPALAGGTIRASGHGDHGWVVIEQSWREAASWDLYHAPVSAPVGSLARVMTLAEEPAALIAGERRAVMVFAAQPGPGGESRRPVRSVTAVRRAAGGLYGYLPQGRALAEAPLPGSGVLVGTGLSPEGPAALLRATTDRGAGRLLVLTGSAWEDRPLPEAVAPLAAWTLDEVPGGLVLRDGTGSWVWISDEGWRDEVFGVPATARLLASGAQHVAYEAAEDPPGTIRFSLLQSGMAFELAEITGAAEGAAVMAAGDSLSAFWFDAEEPNRVRATVVSAISGQTLYGDFVGSPSPLGREDLQLLTLVAASVLLIVLLFLLRPEGELHAEPTVPEGTALAEPLPRLMAAVIDVLPAAAASSLLWGVEIWAAVSPGLALEVSAGLGPIFTTGAIYFAHSALSEWVSGRTLGKALTGLRTVDAQGKEGVRRLRLKQAVMRNLFKAVFPPLTILLLLDPARRHPADQVASTLVVGRAAGGSGAGPGDGDERG